LTLKSRVIAVIPKLKEKVLASGFLRITQDKTLKKYAKKVKFNLTGITTDNGRILQRQKSLLGLNHKVSDL
jgi:hypothetical protein